MFLSVGKYGVGLSVVFNGVVSFGKRLLVLVVKVGVIKFIFEVGMMYKGCFGVVTGAGIVIGVYFVFYGMVKKLF